MSSISIEELYSIYLQHPNIQTDSRKVQKGDIYFALKGENFDGNNFAQDAINQGATYAIVDNAKYANNVNIFYVNNSLYTLQRLAKHHRDHSKAIVLAITGTNGKTTTKELIAAVLGSTYNIIYTQGNLNNHIGVPLSLLSIKKDTEIAIIEMGANHIGEIASYCEWATPDYGVITNIGKAHLEGFGSVEGIKIAKGELYQSISKNGKAIFRYADAEHLDSIAPHNITNILYSSTNKGIINGRTINSQITLDMNYYDQLNNKYTVHTKLVGNYNLPNLLCAISIGNFFNIDNPTIISSLEKYEPSNSRSQLMKINTNTIILDAYNANPTSMTLAINNFNQLCNKETDYILLGAMKEMGSNEIEEHTNLIKLLQELQFKNVYLVGKEYQVANNSYMTFEDSKALASYLKENTISNAQILIKGSRGSKMEEVLEALS